MGRFLENQLKEITKGAEVWISTKLGKHNIPLKKDKLDTAEALGMECKLMI